MRPGCFDDPTASVSMQGSLLRPSQIDRSRSRCGQTIGQDLPTPPGQLPRGIYSCACDQSRTLTINARVYVCVRACVCMRLCVCMRACACVCVCECARMCMSIYRCMCTSMCTEVQICIPPTPLAHAASTPQSSEQCDQHDNLTNRSGRL